MTMSGFNFVTQSVGGIVPPPGTSMQGKLFKTVNLLSTLFTMKLTKLLCLHMYLSVSSIILQQLSMLFVVPLFTQSLQFSLFLYFHLQRFARVGRVSML